MIKYLKSQYFGPSLMLLFLLMASPASGRGQDICPIKSVKMGTLSGYVYDAYKTEVPVKKASLELYRIADDELPIAAVQTDETGRFEFGKLPNGRYRLSVFLKVDGVISTTNFDIAVKIKNTESVGVKHTFLIRLGVNCYDSSFSVGQLNRLLTGKTP